jgi:hypothetical protein
MTRRHTNACKVQACVTVRCEEKEKTHEQLRCYETSST